MAMKITFSVEDGPSRHNAITEIASHDFQGVITDLRKVIEFYDLQAEKHKRDARNREAERRLEVLAGAAKAQIEEPKMETGPHDPFRVFEYDGAFQCRDCHAEWGALPGHPIMPTVCQSAAEVSHE
jgi:hypothetical protein